ncbi:MAG TPA: ABC transporter ATP-binding protein [Sporichthyaceae bacterium]|jgi:lipooligosaccharide transport system ATP-binding protein|nr:ABC transporter ATP-binding protein [Sporichthyaceae bacterium]
MGGTQIGQESVAPQTAPAPPVLVSARGLTKSYGSFTAVSGIDFDIPAGQSFGFLGPNGAGKSSTMRMIQCVSPPTAGFLRVFGEDPVAAGARIRARLGVVPQEDTLDNDLTVRENLLVYARYFGIGWSAARARAAELLEFVQLTDRSDARVATLSGGMKRRLTIARSLVNSPQLLLLDEPTTGLDPQARHSVWDRLSRLKREGVTLVLTTHYMDEAEQLCDRLVVLDGGLIVAEGSPRELIERYSSREVVELRFAGDVPPVETYVDLAGRVERVADRVLLYVEDGDTVAAAAAHRSPPAASVLVRRSGLEDVFLRLTGRTLVD